MEIAAAATLAMTMKRAEFQQDLQITMMKQALQQDTAVLQIVAAATQSPAQAAAGGVGQLIDITV
jgi:hypothetical protein